jgi:hypothetical protein
MWGWVYLYLQIHLLNPPLLSLIATRYGLMRGWVGVEKCCFGEMAVFLVGQSFAEKLN